MAPSQELCAGPPTHRRAHARMHFGGRDLTRGCRVQGLKGAGPGVCGEESEVRVCARCRVRSVCIKCVCKVRRVRGHTGGAVYAGPPTRCTNKQPDRAESGRHQWCSAETAVQCDFIGKEFQLENNLAMKFTTQNDPYK